MAVVVVISRPAMIVAHVVLKRDAVRLELARLLHAEIVVRALLIIVRVTVIVIVISSRIDFTVFTLLRCCCRAGVSGTVLVSVPLVLGGSVIDWFGRQLLMLLLLLLLGGGVGRRSVIRPLPGLIVAMVVTV